MSIWASVWKDEARGLEYECRASDLSDERTDNYRGTGAEDLELGVATATSWNDKIRLSVIPDERGGLDVDLLLSEASAEALRDMLDVALARLRAVRGSDERNSS